MSGITLRIVLPGGGRLLALFIAVLLGGWLPFPGSVAAQQRIGYVDSDEILRQLPDYASIQQRLDRQAADWENEIKAKQTEAEALFTAYQAREMLYTREERDRKRGEIVQVEDEISSLRLKYFGPEGELFTQQDNLMRPLQERILAAVEEVATREGYDYVLDKSGDYLFLFYREQYDLSESVLEELGIDIDQGGQGRQSN
jgi:outer membrane protein